MSKKVRSIVGTAAPLAGLIPGVGLPLAIALGAGGQLLAGNGLKGAAIGSLGGALTGGGAGLLGNAVSGGLGLGLEGTAASSGLGGALLGAGAGGLSGGTKGALIGGGVGGAGSYLANGGLSQIGNAVGLSGAGAGTAGSASTPWINPDTGIPAGGFASASSPAAAPWINPDTGIPAGGFASASSTLASAPKASSGLSSALTGGTGGGASSYGNLGTLAAVGGAANSLYANSQAQDELEKAGRNAESVLSPYLTSGASANNRLSELLGTGGDGSAEGYGSLTKQFTADDLMNDPGYKFQLEQGNRALDRQQAAKGGYFSGAALKAAEDYGTGLADSTYRDAFARDASTKAQQYGMFAGQSGVGQNAANSTGEIMTGIGNAKAGATINSASQINQLLSSLLSGSGAKRPINMNGQIYYV